MELKKQINKTEEHLKTLASNVTHESQTAQNLESYKNSIEYYFKNLDTNVTQDIRKILRFRSASRNIAKMK